VVVKSTVPNNTDNEIEVLDERPYGRIRIRERQGASWQDFEKCSISLTPDQLEDHARECLALAAQLRTPLEESPQ
jgi:hypothetical protein